MAPADGPEEAPAPGERKRKAGGEARDNLVAKRIRVLNGSGKLRQPLALGPVAAALSSLNMRQAIAILKGLEDKAADVPDPLAYVHTAVRDAGGVVPEPGDAAMEEDEEEEEEAPTSAVKQEVGARDFFGAKTEELTEVEKIERRVAWINRNCKLQQPLNAGEVLPALDCIGYKQSMKVLRRFQETAETVEDPNEYVRDLVARSGWIWGKPDIIDDDEKVAKRVAWLNQFGGLQQPIDFAEVADLLDGLKVAHAMVVLRELEVQSHKVEDPTAWIKQAVGSAGLDEVPLPAVDEDTAVARRISSLNESGGLSAPIEYKEVGHDLQRIGDEEALQILQEVASKGGKVKDPTGFIKFKLKAKLAALNAAAEAPVSDETKILKRVEWLNDYGGLARDIDYDKVATALENVGLDHAMTILKELEDQRQGVRDPNAFILSAVKASWKRAAAGIPTPQAAAAPRPPAAQAAAAAQKGKEAESGTTVLKALSSFMSFVSKNPQVKKAVNFGELASALDVLGPKRAVQVLQQMQNTGLGLEDPLAFVRAAAQRRLLTSVKKEAQEEEPEDDVDKITKRLKWLNQFAGLARKIRINDVVGALYCLGIPQTMEILRDLQEQASKVPDPTWFITASVQRANGMPVGPPPPLGAADDEGGEEEADGAEGEPDEFAGEDDLAPDDGEAGVEVQLEDEELANTGVVEAAKVGGEEGGWAGWDEDDDWDAAFAGAPSKPAAARTAQQPATSPAKPQGDAKAGQGAPRRVVGGISGATGKLVPTRPDYPDANLSKMLVKSEPVEEEEAPRQREDSPPPQPPSPPAGASAASALPITPQEKMLQVRELALKHNLDLDQACLRALARLPFHRAKDMIMDVVLGGRNRQGVWNPSKYLMVGCQKMTTGLGVEQGLAMELAVSLGVVLNNDALDELASIPRKESQAVIRELAKNPEAKKDPLGFIRAEVLKCRAQMDARPWPPAT